MWRLFSIQFIHDFEFFRILSNMSGCFDQRCICRYPEDSALRISSVAICASLSLWPSLLTALAHGLTPKGLGTYHDQTPATHYATGSPRCQLYWTPYLSRPYHIVRAALRSSIAHCSSSADNRHFPSHPTPPRLFFFVRVGRGWLSVVEMFFIYDGILMPNGYSKMAKGSSGWCGWY